MKKIHLLRHAKSDWENKTHADIDRPINERGVRTAIFMASQLQNAGYAFVHVYCSPAVRAQSTIELISEHLLEIDFQWQVDNALYTFDSHRLHEWFRLLDESIDEVSIIGHNPALTIFCNQLSNSSITNMPTCGYAQLTASRECIWQDISETPFELSVFLKPKDLM